MKIKENYFKNFNDVKVILNKKKNLQVMYVRDFRASILACKAYKINIKTTLKILAFLFILFVSVFWPLFTLCSHGTKMQWFY